jgi:hypothetical protein
LLVVAALVWLAFWVAGLPDYYQQYSFGAMVGFSIVLVPAIALVGFKVIGRARIEKRKSLGFWLSFYFTIPLLVFDGLYCGLYLGYGWEFLVRFWYLTAYYLVPWLVFVPIGHFLARRQAA